MKTKVRDYCHSINDAEQLISNQLIIYIEYMTIINVSITHQEYDNVITSKSFRSFLLQRTSDTRDRQREGLSVALQ